MNIIFLDFDGVLNSVRSAVANLAYRGPDVVHKRREVIKMELTQRIEARMQFNNDQWSRLDKVAIGLIDQLCVEAPAEVVISSTWRLWTPYEEFNNRFSALGFRNLKVIGKTPDLDHVKRGYEVEKWLRTTEMQVNSYVILDDDSDMLPDQMKNFVHVRSTNGMMLEHYRDALRILNPNHSSLVQYDKYNSHPA